MLAIPNYWTFLALVVAAMASVAAVMAIVAAADGNHHVANKHSWDQGIVSLEASLAKTAPTKSAGTKDSVQFKCYFKMIWQHCEALSSRTESLTERSQFRNWPSSELHALAIESRIKMSSWLTSQVHFRTKWPLFAAWFSTKSTAHSYEAQKKKLLFNVGQLY